MTQSARKAKFKICLVTISLAKGGAERSCAMLSQMLSHKGHRVHIVTLNSEIDFPVEGTIFNLRKVASNKNLKAGRIQRFRVLRKFLITEKFDVIIDHRPKNNFLKEHFYQRYVYKGLKKIYVIHSSNTPEYFTKKPTSFTQIYNSNASTVAVSEYINKQIAVPKGVSNCVTIHNAFDPSWAQARETEIKIDAPYILSYGRMDNRIKDFKFLMSSFTNSMLWQKGFKLVILGDGIDKGMLIAFSQKLPSKHCIEFLPFTSSPFSIIKNARCVTLTSKYEGFPMVLVESLSLGTPVVSLDIISGPNEIITSGTNGLLVKERNEAHFAEALQTICTNDTLYSQLKSNTIPSVEKYTMDEIGEKWNQLLQHALH